MEKEKQKLSNKEKKEIKNINVLYIVMCVLSLCFREVKVIYFIKVEVYDIFYEK